MWKSHGRSGDPLFGLVPSILRETLPRTAGNDSDPARRCPSIVGHPVRKRVAVQVVGGPQLRTTEGDGDVGGAKTEDGQPQFHLRPIRSRPELSELRDRCRETR